ncbi:MAG TPA: TIR domain-containing protein [Caulobacteraceae bacterium]
MADIFISYKRENRPFAERLSIVLEQLGFEVWWDFDLLSGDRYRRVIRAIIDECKVAVVIWSELAIQSDFVLDEADYAKAQGKLCPARIDDVVLPFGFGSIHTDDLRSWDGELFDPHFQSLVKAVETRVGRKGRLGDSGRPMETQAAAAEMEAFKAAQLAGNTAALETFLDLYPRGAFARFVRRQLETMSVEAPMVRFATRANSPGPETPSPSLDREPPAPPQPIARQAPASSPPQRETPAPTPAPRPIGLAETITLPGRAPQPPERGATLRGGLLGLGGAAVIALVAWSLLRPHGHAPATAPAPVPAALAATQPAALATLAGPLVGVWAPAGLTCKEAETISAAGVTLTMTSAGAPWSAIVTGAGADGAVDVVATDGKRFSYQAHGDTLTVLSRDAPDGGATRMTRCKG